MTLRRPVDVAGGDEAAVTDGDVSNAAGGPGSVDDEAACDQGVCHCDPPTSSVFTNGGAASPCPHSPAVPRLPVGRRPGPVNGDTTHAQG